MTGKENRKAKLFYTWLHTSFITKYIKILKTFISLVNGIANSNENSEETNDSIHYLNFSGLHKAFTWLQRTWI